MKLETLIKKLDKAKNKYKEKHGIDPVIFSVDGIGGDILLCSKIKTDGCLKSAKKPYMNIKVGLDKFL